MYGCTCAVQLHGLSQSISVAVDIVAEAAAATPKDYALAGTGYAVTCGQIIHARHPEVNEQDTHTFSTGISRARILQIALVVRWAARASCFRFRFVFAHAHT